MKKNLTVVITNCDDEYFLSKEYRLLVKEKMYFDNLFTIKSLNRDESSKSNLLKVINSLDSEYFVVIDSSHTFSNNYLHELIKKINTDKQFWLVEPNKYVAKIPAKYKKLKSEDYYTRDFSIYGVCFKTLMFNEFVKVNSNIDFNTLYINYRLFYAINSLTLINAGYSISSDAHLLNGIEFDDDANYLFINYPNICEEVQIYQLRYIILMLRKLKTRGLTKFSTDIVRVAMNNIDYAAIKKYILVNDAIESGMLEYFVQNTEKSKVLFKKLDNKDIYLTVSENNVLENGVCLYEIKFADKILHVNKEYLDKPTTFTLKDMKDYEYHNSKITKDSTLIFLDRGICAGDNAEYLYEYFINNYPEYKNAYFAIHPKSKDWKRLSLKGFKLLPIWSDEFLEKFYESDVVISSQIYNRIAYKGKNFSNSRFVYLQHGIIWCDMKDWVSSKCTDLFVATGENEAEWLRNFLPMETINAGIPRLDNLHPKDDPKYITYMPTWRLYLNKLNDANFIKSEYFNRIMEFINDSRLQKYLEDNEKTLVLKLHPNIVNRQHLFSLPKNVIISEESYSDIISNSKIIVTDYSSAVLDAAFVKIPIAYYQYDKEEFFENHTYNKRIDVETDGQGAFFDTLNPLIDYIINEEYLNDRDVYEKRHDEFFKGVPTDDICKNLIERILKL